MAKTHAQILEQIAALQQKADAAKRKEVPGVISRIRVAIEHYGLTAADLGLSAYLKQPSTQASSKRAKVKPKVFADGKGNTWSGRGPRLQWLKQAMASGKTLEDFAGSAATKTNKRNAKSPRPKVVPKYRDAAGNTWAARGSQPRWLKEALAKGATLQSFAV